MFPGTTAMDEKEKTEKREGSFDSEADSSQTSSYEQQREELRISNPQGVTSTLTGVNVEKAEHDFEELNRQFSSISHQARHLSKQASRASRPTVTTEDVEGTGSSADSDDPWDLETTLRGNRTAEEEAGIKDKHIGEKFDYSFRRGSSFLLFMKGLFGIIFPFEEWEASRPISRPFPMRSSTFSTCQKQS